MQIEVWVDNPDPTEDICWWPKNRTVTNPDIEKPGMKKSDPKKPFSKAISRSV